jgi:hypothetical protein
VADSPEVLSGFTLTITGSELAVLRHDVPATPTTTSPASASS